MRNRNIYAESKDYQHSEKRVQHTGVIGHPVAKTFTQAPFSLNLITAVWIIFLCQNPSQPVSTTTFISHSLQKCWPANVNDLEPIFYIFKSFGPSLMFFVLWEIFPEKFHKGAPIPSFKFSFNLFFLGFQEGNIIANVVN